MNKKEQASLIRLARRIHRALAAGLFILFLFISVTGILLGWKKNSNDIIMPGSYEGSTTNTAMWMSLDTLKSIAFATLRDSVSPALSTNLDRIDARPSKGMVKFVFENHYHEIQLDAANGEVLVVAKRRSDIIENIHDGSVLDHAFNTGNGIFKLFYTSILGIALFIFTLTGFWLWYGPKLMGKQRNRKKG